MVRRATNIEIMAVCESGFEPVSAELLAEMAAYVRKADRRLLLAEPDELMDWRIA